MKINTPPEKNTTKPASGLPKKVPAMPSEKTNIKTPMIIVMMNLYLKTHLNSDEATL
jgi:hypothetical protein